MLHSVACQGVSRTKASGGMSEYLESYYAPANDDLLLDGFFARLTLKR